MAKQHPHRVALLHTSPVHVDTFNNLFAEFRAEVELEHFVAEELLAEAQKVGSNNASLVELVQRAMVGSSRGGASVVVCTCSTIGGAAERTNSGGKFKAMRIDRAMADRAVILGPKILIAAALESTLSPTHLLIEESAIALGRLTSIETLHVPRAWQYFVDGNKDRYIQEIVAGIRHGIGQANVVVLAQASMAPAAEALAGLGVEILTSPRLGVVHIMEELRSDAFSAG